MESKNDANVEGIKGGGNTRAVALASSRMPAQMRWHATSHF